MSSTRPELEDRLAACEAELSAQRGYLKGLEYAMRTAIVTHHDPQGLSRDWQALVPAIIKRHETDESKLFSAGFKQVLALLTEQIEAAARRTMGKAN